MIEVDLQNPYDFDTIPDKKDLQIWSNATMQKSELLDINDTVNLVVRVVNEDEGIELNHSYRDKKSATNILSFPYEVPEYAADIPELQDEYSQQYLGDLVLCEKVVITEAKAQNKTLKQHWAHLIVHGVLHLQGYDHIDDNDATIMESLEIEILEKLGFDNPYSVSL
jgi:probable rRNA maturation factor